MRYLDHRLRTVLAQTKQLQYRRKLTWWENVSGITTEDHSTERPFVAAACREGERPRTDNLYAVLWESDVVGKTKINQQPVPGVRP